MPKNFSLVTNYNFSPHWGQSKSSGDKEFASLSVLIIEFSKCITPFNLHFSHLKDNFCVVFSGVISIGFIMLSRIKNFSSPKIKIWLIKLF